MVDRQRKEKIVYAADTPTEKIVADIGERFEKRQCFVCGEDSGNDTMLPPGWSYTTFAHTGDLAGFFCDRCAADLKLPEARNYCEESN